MIGVFVGPEGNIIIRCSVCDETWALAYRLHESPFWEVFVGNAVLVGLAHYMEHSGNGTRTNGSA